MLLKRLKLFGLMAFISTMMLVACEDDFTEEDFLKLQNELAIDKEQRDSAYLANLSQEQAEAYIAALNDAGDFMSVTVLVRADNVPIAGVTVSADAGNLLAGGRTSATAAITATTDANGVALFERFPIGAATVGLTKTGFVSASAVLDFGTPPSPISTQVTINGITRTIWTVPAKRLESIVLPIFSKDASQGGSVATIKGTVTIDTDVTNATEEAAAGTQVKANLTNLLSGITFPGSVTPLGYAFDEGNMGTATVAADGTYSMIVPASAAGRTIDLIFPEITANQRIAITTRNDEDVTPEYASVPTIFGPGVGAYDDIPFVSGAKATFDAPPTPGQGLKLAFSTKSRGFTDANYGYPWTENDPTQEFRAGASVFQLTNIGRYTASPAITITGGGGTGAEMVAALEGYLTGLTVTNAGTGYGVEAVVNIDFRWIDNDDNEYSINNFNTTSTPGGTLPSIITLPTSGFGFVESNQFNTYNNWNNSGSFNVKGFKIVVTGAGTGAVVTPTVTAGVGALRVEEIGSGYSSAPTVTFAAGTGGNTATLAIREFYTQFYVTLDNSANVGDYSVIPSEIQYRLINTGGNWINPTSNEVIDVQGNSYDLEDIVTVVGGDVVYQDAAKTYYTTAFGKSPSSLVENVVVEIAEATVNIDDGEFDGLNVNNLGRGYTGIFNVTIAPKISGAPGTGAKLILTEGSFNSNSREYFWQGDYFTESVGSGYLDNLNVQDTKVNYSGTASVSVKTGEVKTINVKYGTGKRLEIVGGE